ncbi:hypothetical protein [Actinokineospora sp.]|uniref:hypothetical protein n=1 Tax=Actinokineospora sp. TaxID=1872133 RepID=UPI004037D7B8
MANGPHSSAVEQAVARTAARRLRTVCEGHLYTLLQSNLDAENEDYQRYFMAWLTTRALTGVAMSEMLSGDRDPATAPTARSGPSDSIPDGGAVPPGETGVPSGVAPVRPASGRFAWRGLTRIVVRFVVGVRGWKGWPRTVGDGVAGMPLHADGAGGRQPAIVLLPWSPEQDGGLQRSSWSPVARPGPVPRLATAPG